MKHSYVYVPAATMPYPASAAMLERPAYWFNFETGNLAHKLEDTFLSVAHKFGQTGADVIQMPPREDTFAAPTAMAIEQQVVKERSARRSNKSLLWALVAVGTFLVLQRAAASFRQPSETSQYNQLIWEENKTGVTVAKAEATPPQQYWYEGLKHFTHHYSDDYEAGTSSRHESYVMHEHVSDRTKFENLIFNDMKFSEGSAALAFAQIKNDLTKETSNAIEIASPLGGVALENLQINRRYGPSPLAAMGEGDNYIHRGTDLQAYVGQDVLEAVKGGATITDFFYDGPAHMGYVETITASGVKERYRHVIPNPDLEIGQHFDQGEKIAEISPKDAKSTGKHLDYLLMIGNDYINSTHAIENGYISYNSSAVLIAKLGRRLVDKILTADNYAVFQSSLEPSENRYLANIPTSTLSEEFKDANVEFIAMDDHMEGGDHPAIDNDGGKVNFGLNQNSNPDIDPYSLTLHTAKQLLRSRYIDRATRGISSPALYTAVSAAAILHPADIPDLLDRCDGDAHRFLELEREILWHRSGNSSVQRAWTERINRVRERIERIESKKAIVLASDTLGKKTPPRVNADAGSKKQRGHRVVRSRENEKHPQYDLFQKWNKADDKNLAYQPGLKTNAMAGPKPFIEPVAATPVTITVPREAVRSGGGSPKNDAFQSMAAIFSENNPTVSTTRPGLKYRYSFV